VGALALRELACPALGPYTPPTPPAGPVIAAGTATPGGDGEAASSPPRCADLLTALRFRAAVGSSPAPGAGGAPADAYAARIAPGAAPDGAPSAPVPANGTVPIPGAFRGCVAMTGPDGARSRHADGAWFYLGEYFLARPTRDFDRTNAWAVAALEQSVADPRGALYRHALLRLAEAHYRLTNGYPAALGVLARLLDVEAARGDADGTRLDGTALYRMAMILQEPGWDAQPELALTRCQAAVEQIAAPGADAVRPFDCAGIDRLAAPRDALDLVRAAEPDTVAPQPGRVAYVPGDRPWLPALWRSLADQFFTRTAYYEAVTAYVVYLHLFPTAPGVVQAAERVASAYEAMRAFESATDARLRLADYLDRIYALNPQAPRAAAVRGYVRGARLAAVRALDAQVPLARARADALARCVSGDAVPGVCAPARTRAQRRALAAQASAAGSAADDLRARTVAAAEGFLARHATDVEAAFVRGVLTRWQQQPAGP
jgi:hypothetical protein